MIRKQLYVYHEGVPVEAVIRRYTELDFEGLIDVQCESFPPPFPAELWWSKEQLAEHVSRFPEGALCAEVGGRLIGSMTGLIIHMDDYGHSHSWEAITDNGFIRNHNRSGDTLYVVDICVIPEYRKSGIGKWLMQTMYETVVHLQLVRLLGGGRMPGYYRYAEEITPESYVSGVVAGKYSDPVLSFLLRCGRTPTGIAANYLEDEQSCGYAALMEWRNPFFAAD
ncbi:GNAT family N-acetyltransferase [Paenibacillus sp. Leaf72]|uniref:GNAT family N-acetyltransferase n=1 Tax=Paenibacillus sp. Leaf72 TaxID=1736234 RepID=UPI0006F28221|nr:GNAT family N-acetyltransferase [Paenibacillus sp. Leaf72]KQO00689.1 acetyltransferase [Paenibacillus sp. Leaf72]